MTYAKSETHHSIGNFGDIHPALTNPGIILEKNRWFRI